MLGISTPRLKKAPGPTSGKMEAEKNDEVHPKSKTRFGPLRILIFGDSVACGVGCPSNEKALAGACADSFTQRTGRSVRWDVLGVSGYTASDMANKLVPKIKTLLLSGERYDACIISCGVNHVLSLHTQAKYAKQLANLLDCLRVELGGKCVILLGSMPPMEKFPQVSYLQPLNVVMGWMASNIGRVNIEVCKTKAATIGPLACVQWDFEEVLAISDKEVKRIMAPDGFHPAYEACRYMSVAMAETFVELTKQRDLVK